MKIHTTCGLAAALFASIVSAGPQPQSDGTITVSYPLIGGGVYTATETRDFNGTNPTDATTFGNPPTNMSMFSSHDVFGRRAHVRALFPGVVGTNETLLTFSWYKLQNGGDYFPGITEDGVVTVRVEGIQFDEPVQFEEDTFLFHNLWDTAQFDTAVLRGLFEPDMHGHYFHTLTESFRNEEEFRQVSGEFSPVGEMPHETFGDLAPYITLLGEGTDTIGFEARIPYSLFAHPHEHTPDHGDPYAGLPAPHGFLEPYHFHFETLISPVPEPATLLLLGVGGAASVLRRWKRKSQGHEARH